jgi:hypothetical protein
MDDVEAHVAGADDPEDGVEVGAVVVEQSVGGVDLGGDGLDVDLEEADGIGIGQHEPGDVVADQRSQGVEVDEAPVVGRNLDGAVARHGHGGGIGSVGRVGDDDLGRGPAP